MIDIIFPDGTKKRYSKGVKPIEIAYDISPSLSKNALSASLNNTVVELNSVLNKGGEFGKTMRVKKHFGILLHMF